MINEQLDILIQMTDTKIKYIPSEYLQDPQVVGSFFNAMALDQILQVSFLLKVKLSDIVRLLQTDVLHEEALAHSFLYPTFPLSKIVDILRALPFDSRKWILEFLHQNRFWRYKDLIRRIDAKYGRIEGVFFETMTIQKKGDDLKNDLKKQLLEPKGNLENLQQFVLSLSQDKDNYLDVFKELESDDTVKKALAIPSIKTREDFELTVKLLYFFTISDETITLFSESIDRLIRRVFKRIILHNKVESVVTVMEQLPKEGIKRLLQLIHNQCKSKNSQMRSKCTEIKKKLEQLAEARKVSKILKCIRRYHLGYNISYLIKDGIKGH